MQTESLPSPGLGTAGNTDFEECAETVREALELGYRHVDTAQMYDNEEAVGEASPVRTSKPSAGSSIQTARPGTARTPATDSIFSRGP